MGTARGNGSLGATGYPGDNQRKGVRGLSKREWFTGMAVSGLCANEDDGGRRYAQTAEMAVKMADALLEELEK